MFWQRCDEIRAIENGGRGMWRWVLVSLFTVCFLSQASAACDGDACKNGILRECVRLPSGDGVWVNKNPYTTCVVRGVKPTQKPSATRPATPVVKRQPLTVPSPALTAKEEKCRVAMAAFNDRNNSWKARCPAGQQIRADLADRCNSDIARLKSERAALLRRCPHLRAH